MKYHVKYTYTLSIEKVIEADTEEDAERIVREESKNEVFADNKYAQRDYEIMSYGRFTFDKEHRLLINEVPVQDSQLVLVKYGKGEPTIGRMRYNNVTGNWKIKYEEFIGHTYLDKVVKESNLIHFIVASIEVNHE